MPLEESVLEKENILVLIISGVGVGFRRNLREAVYGVIKKENENGEKDLMKGEDFDDLWKRFVRNNLLYSVGSSGDYHINFGITDAKREIRKEISREDYCYLVSLGRKADERSRSSESIVF